MKDNNKKKKATKRYSHEYYLRQVKSLHSERYTFEKVRYTGASSKITVTCKIHGDFETYPSSFLNSEEFSGCVKCRDEKRLKEKKKEKQLVKKQLTELDRFIKVASKNHYDKYDYSQTVYTGTEETINVICKAHGVFTAVVATHKRGLAPCLKCKSNRSRWGKTRAEEEYNRLCKINGYK